MFIVLFIRNRGTLSSHICLFKDLAYHVWRANFKNILWFLEKKSIYFEFPKKKMLSMKKTVLIKNIVFRF